MAGEVELLECPICPFSVLPSDAYVLRLHFEQIHTTDSPFRIDDDPEPLPQTLPTRPSLERTMPSRSQSPSSDASDSVVECPVPDCGELIPLNDYNDHLDFHAASTLSFDEATGTYSSKPAAAMAVRKSSKKYPDVPSFVEQHFNTAVPDALRRKTDGSRKLKKEKKKDRSTRGSEDSARTSISRSILSFYPFKGNKIVRPPASNARLGRRELGPYAWEDRMPRWLHDQLAKGPKITTVNRIGRDGRLIKSEIVQNETPGIIPILAQLSALDHSVQEAYYCHPSTLHIGKTPNEGAFCGYRNIQMLLSYVQGSHAQGHEQFPGRTPGILKLQDVIERAWDMGINSISRQQTGGIRDTRKYIGTPEAQAFFLGSEVDCAVEQFCDQEDLDLKAHDALFAATESYFAQASANDGSNVHKTHLPPMYLQHEGHSLTIVGFERHKNGKCNLMVFDPSYFTSPAMHRLVGRKNIRNSRDDVMFAYRRGLRALGKFSAFEILLLTAPPPKFPAWDVLRQFPDIRFLYVFFRTRTLGYDVYPEDHFLRNFPWQQYGGLWNIDEARFARSTKMSPIAAQALRRITSQGSSSSGSVYSRSDDMIRSLHGSQPTDALGPYSIGNHGTRSWSPAIQTSFMAPLSDAHPAIPHSAHDDAIDPILNMIGMHPAQTQAKDASALPTLSLQSDVQRRSPGYPMHSPTEDAKFWYPSPISNTRSGGPTPRANTPMSIDGSSMCGPSRYCNSHGYNHYGPGADTYCLSDTGGSDRALNDMPYVSLESGFSTTPVQLETSPSRSVSTASISPASPISPRAAIFKRVFQKQAFQYFSQFHRPVVSSAGIPRLDPGPDWDMKMNMPCSSYDGAASFIRPSDGDRWAPESPSESSQSTSPPPSLCIATGTEYYTPSPISPHGRMMWYFSNRPTDSGFLAVPPLNEAQVAEYRFWRPCGKRSCAFGCGGANEGEMAAAKRLFRDEEIVQEEPAVEDEDEAVDKVAEKPRMSTEDYIKMLQNRSREGVADI